MMNRFLLLASATLLCAWRMTGQVTVDLVLANPMPSELSVWEQDPTLLQVVITNADPAGYLNVGLSFVVRNEATDAVVAQSQDNRIPRFDVLALSAVTRLGPDIYRGNAVTIDERIRTIAITTNRLPEGDYRFCLRLVDANGNNIANTGEVCRSFTVIIPDPPELILPEDGHVFLDNVYPTFRWTPVHIVPGMEEARYRLLIAPMLQGQSPRDAIERNTPQFEGTIQANSYTYGVADLPFRFAESGTPFAWQVQAINRENLPAARNDGKSEIWTFSVDSTGGELELSVSRPPTIRFHPRATSYDFSLTLHSTGPSIRIDAATLQLRDGESVVESQRLSDVEGVLVTRIAEFRYTYNHQIPVDGQQRILGDRESVTLTWTLNVSGHVEGGERVLTQTDEAQAMICRSATGELVVSSVTSPSPTPLVYDPVTVSHQVSFRLYNPGCQSVTLRRALGVWTTPDDSRQPAETDLRDERITLAPGRVHTWSTNLVIDGAIQAGLLRRFEGDEVRLRITYDFEGVDEEGGSVGTGIAASEIEAVVRRSSLTITASSPTGFPMTFAPNATVRQLSFTFSNRSEVDLRVVGYRAIAHNPDGTTEPVEETFSSAIAVAAGGSASWDKTFNMDSNWQARMLQRFGLDSMRVRVEYAFTVTDAGGRREQQSAAQPDPELAIYRTMIPGQAFVVTASSPTGFPMTFAPNATVRQLSFTFSNRSEVDLRVVGYRAIAHNPDGTTEPVGETFSSAIPVAAGGSASWDKTFNMDSNWQARMLQRFGLDSMRVRVEYAFTVTDAGGRSEQQAAAQPDPELAIYRTMIPEQAFVVTASSPSGFPLNYFPGVYSHPVTFTFSNNHALAMRVSRYSSTWHVADTTLRVEDNLPQEITVPTGESREWFTNLPLDSASQAWPLRRFGGDAIRVRVEYIFPAVDPDGVIQNFTAQPDVELNINRQVREQLVVFGIPGDVSYYPGMTSNAITYNLDLYPSAAAPVTLQTVRVTFRHQDGSLFRGPDSTTLNPTINLPVGGVATSEAQLSVSDLERDALLAGGRDTALITATAEFVGANNLGQAISASANAITMRIFRTAQLAGAERYTLMEGVAYIRGTNRTTITSAGNLRTLNGPATLVLIPEPFDSTTSQVPVELTNLTFDMSAGQRVTAGFLLAESPPDGMLLSLYSGILKLTRISYDHARADTTRLRADQVYVSLGRRRLDFTDVVINRSGVSFRNASIEQSMFGLTFRFTDMQSGRDGGHRMMAFTTHARLKGKPRNEEFVSAPLKLFENGDYSGHFTPTPALRIIPNTHYLDFSDFEFKKTGDDWFMKVTARSAFPAPFKILDTMETSFKIDQDGNITGEIAPIKELTPGIEAGDRTQVPIGQFAKVDLTYFGLLLSMVDGSLDEEHSRVGLAADFYFNDGTPDWYRVSVGTANDPGVYIDFAGNIDWAAITIARDKKIKVGPAYVKLSSFIVNPEPDDACPYYFLLSGGLGLDFERVDGELNFQSIRIKENGKFDMHEAIIRGGMFNIVDIIGVSLDSLDFKDEPSDLTFKRKRNGQSEDYTINVDSYFRLAGAALNIGPSGDGGSGRFKELLLYTRDGNQNMVLRQAEVTIASCVIKADCQYVTDDPDLGTAMSLAGTVHTPKFEGIVVGKGGETPAGDPSYGLFIAVGGLNIQLGPVTLDQLGGGFFYNPLESDLELVRTACGITRPEIRDSIRTRRPAGAGDPGSFAAMVYAGAFVGSPDVANGRALLTVTENSMSVDMEVNVLRGVGEGAAYTVFGWDPTYLEGVIRFEMNYHSVVSAEAELDFYAYADTVWGINGSCDVRILILAEADADFFIGPPGFMLSTRVEASFNVVVLSAEAGLETMVWWRKDVSWGAYMKVWAEGEILAGLVGVSGTLEGALIGEPDYLIYCVGQFRAEVCWVEVFDGSIWITVGANGFDGDIGRNSKYDALIADARDMASQMEKEMDDLASEMEDAQNALLDMSNEQIARAGQTLMTTLTHNSIATALYYLSYKTDHDDYEGTATTQAALREVLFGRTPRNHRWWMDTLATGKQALADKEEEVHHAIEALSAKRQRMQQKLDAYRNLLTAELPTIQDYQYRNPVGGFQYSVVNINGVGRNVRHGFEFDTLRANQNLENTIATKEATRAFEERLFELTDQFKRNLDTIDNLLYGGREPVRNISKDYADAFENINDYYTEAVEYSYNVQNLAATHRNSLRARQADIRAAIHTQTEAVGPNNNALRRVRALANLREGTLRSLDSTYNPVRGGNALADWKEFTDTLGVLMWYDVPEAGFTYLVTRSIASRDTTRAVFEQTRRAFVSSWNDYTETLEGIYSRNSRLYELLFDLYDQLSLTATRTPLTEFKRRLLGNLTPQQYFSAARDRIGTYLQAPTISSFTGSARSTTDNSAKVTLNFAASHAQGVAEYAYEVNSPPAPGGGGIFITTGFPHFRSVGTDTRTSFLLVQEYGSGRPDRAGDYDIFLRARARSGYSITRRGTVTVEYSTGTTVSNALTSTDNTPPTMPAVTDAGEHTPVTNTLFARWSSSDAQSGIQEYRYAVETQTTQFVAGRWLILPFRIREWTTVGGMTEMNIRDLTLQHNKTYWVKVEAKNGVGLWSATGSSDGITVDTSAPSTPTITEFRRNGSTSAQNRLSFRWIASTDDQSGLDRYEYAVGRNPFGTDVKDWAHTNFTNITTSSLPLYNGDACYLTVKAFNGAGLSKTDTAVTVISYADTTAPDPPDITQAYYRTSDSTLVARWNATDPESGIAEYHYSFTTSNRGFPWTAWTANGRANTLNLKTFPRPTKVRIKAVNGISLFSTHSQSVERR